LKLTFAFFVLSLPAPNVRDEAANKIQDRGGMEKGMDRKAVTGITLTLLLIGALGLVFDVGLVGAGGTIYIRADGSIDPPTAPIQFYRDVYTFRDNIYDQIVVQRSNIIIDGNGYTLEGTGGGYGFYLERDINNVTVKKVNIKSFSVGIYLNFSSNNTIVGNSITNSNSNGIDLSQSHNNTISANNITNSVYMGIVLTWCSYDNNIYGNSMLNGGIEVQQGSSGNNVYGNSIIDSECGIRIENSMDVIVRGNSVMNSTYGIFLILSSGNMIYENSLMNGYWGIYLSTQSYLNRICRNRITNNTYGIFHDSTLKNIIYHNNFINNTCQALGPPYYDGPTEWDDGYPSGGNYWSDYTGVDLFSGPYQNKTGSDGIGDTPYVIDVSIYKIDQDRYPLMNPWPLQHDITITNITPSKTVVSQGYSLNINVTAANQGDYTETFNITAYANTTIINTLTNVTLAGGSSTTITFIWNTSGFAKGNYTITAIATPVPNETDTKDNTIIDGWVVVTIMGDVDGDFDCDADDVFTYISPAYGTKGPPKKYPADPNYNPNCDFDGDGDVDADDVFMYLAPNYGKKDC